MAGGKGKKKNPRATVELERIWIWPWIIWMLPLSYKSLLKTLQTLRRRAGDDPTRHIIAFVHIFRPTDILPQSFILHHILDCKVQGNHLPVPVQCKTSRIFSPLFMKVDVVTTCDPPQHKWPRAHTHTNTYIHQNWTANNHRFSHLNVAKRCQTFPSCLISNETGTKISTKGGVGGDGGVSSVSEIQEEELHFGQCYILVMGYFTLSTWKIHE